MAIKNYEVRCSIKTEKSILSNVLLGEAEIDENSLSGNREAFLKPFAQSRFAGEIGRHKGELISVSVTERPSRKKSPDNSTTSSSGGNKKIGKVFSGLFLIIFVWLGYYLIDSLKSAYYSAPIKAWNWFKNFIQS